MKVRCIDAKGFRQTIREGWIYEGELKFNDCFEEDRWVIKGIEGVEFRKHRFEEVKELTFKEVISNIQKGEVWEDDIFEVDCTECGTIRIKNKKNKVVFGFYKDDTLKLQRKEYTFEEAFKAYEEGKEIECCYGGQKLKKENEKDYYFNYDKEEYIPLKFDEVFFDIANIRSKWYIND